MSAPAPDRFTQRERQCLTLVARGYTNGQIGRHLYLSEDTVKSHLRRAYQKLGVTSRILAVEQARRLQVLLPGAELGLAPEVGSIAARGERRIRPADLHWVASRWAGRAPAGLIDELRQLINGWTPAGEIAS